MHKEALLGDSEEEYVVAMLFPHEFLKKLIQFESKYSIMRCLDIHIKRNFSK